MEKDQKKQPEINKVQAKESDTQQDGTYLGRLPDDPARTRFQAALDRT